MTTSTPTKHFPRHDSTLPFWRTQLHEIDTHRTTSELPAEADVVIVGSGYAGTSTAYHLLDNNDAPPSIVMLEAREACSGATGRNGGHLKPNTYSKMPHMVKLYGPKLAGELATFEINHVWAIKELIEKEGIDCDLILTRSQDVFLDQAHADKTKAAFDEILKAGWTFPDIKHGQFVSGKYAEQLTGIKGAKSTYSFTAGHVWPYKLITQLLTILVSKGLNLQTNTPVESISDSPDSSGFWTVSTPRGSIKAKKIVFATNGYTSALLPQYSGKIVPVRGICSRIVVPEGKKGPHLPYSYTIQHHPGSYDYLIPRPDGSIVVGGARTLYWNDQKNWYNVSDDTKLIEPAKNYFDGYMQRTFAGWEDSGAHTDKVWTGILGYTSDKAPHVGSVPDKPGQYIVAGFNGHGMPLVYLSAKGVAQMLRGKAFEETGVPSFFKTSKERLESDRDEIRHPSG
ncbi:MAG: hypothetical protein M1834_004859 [Cirrosporium novae-zelandiae]|nr:MAG: hypothetical protein M1834_004859 [Cirrosporium novae-zelandiae]